MPLGDWTVFKMLVEFLRNGKHIGPMFCERRDSGDVADTAPRKNF